MLRDDGKMGAEPELYRWGLYDCMIVLGWAAQISGDRDKSRAHANFRLHSITLFIFMIFST